MFNSDEVNWDCLGGNFWMYLEFAQFEMWDCEDTMWLERTPMSSNPSNPLRMDHIFKHSIFVLIMTEIPILENAESNNEENESQL